MKKFRITYKEHDGITTLDVYDIEIDEGFVAIWIDDSHKGSAPDMAINASLVYKIERIEEDNK